MKKYVLMLMLVATMSIGYADILLADFEGATVPGEWSGGWDGGTLAVGPTGATSGSQALSITPGGSDFTWSVQYSGGILDLDATPLLSVDVTWVNAEWQPGTAGVDDDDWVQMNEVFINATGQGQFGEAYLTDSQNPSYPGSWDPTNWPGPSHTRTLVWDLSSYDMAGVDGWMQLLISCNMGNGYDAGVGTYGNFYIDNVRLLVPEPATLSLLGLGALVLRRRRR